MTNSRRITAKQTLVSPLTSGVIPLHDQQYATQPTSSATPRTASIFNVAASVAQPNLAEAFKPKRAGKNPKLSHIVFVLDESSSMMSCWAQTISGYNEYLNGQKEDSKTSGIQTLVSLYKFNGYNVDCIFDRQDVQEVQPLDKTSYRPAGGTNLHDAMGGVMIKINTLLAEKAKADRESIIITVLTDGEENQSRTFQSTDIKGMVEKAEAKNWGFIFLGANIDAFHAGSALGFGVNNTMQFSTNNMGDTMRSASAMTSRMRGSYSEGMATMDSYAASAFTDVERDAAVGAKDDIK